MIDSAPPAAPRSARLLWALAALAAAFAVVTVVAYALTGTLATPWFVASLFVYGAIFLVALWAAFRPVRAAGADAGKLRLVREDVVYATPAARLLRATYEAPDGPLVRHFAIEGATVAPIHDIEARIDASLSAIRAEVPDEELLAVVLRSHAVKPARPNP